MGGGDIKMMAMIGAFTGAAGVFLTLTIGAMVGIVLHGATLPFRTRSASPPAGGEPLDVETMTSDELSAHGYLPFGVSLAVAAALVWAVGADRMIDWYLGYVAGG